MYWSQKSMYLPRYCELRLQRWTTLTLAHRRIFWIAPPSRKIVIEVYSTGYGAALPRCSVRPVRNPTSCHIQYTTPQPHRNPSYPCHRSEQRRVGKKTCTHVVRSGLPHVLVTEIDVSPEILRVTTPTLDHANPSAQTHILDRTAIAENCY